MTQREFDQLSEKYSQGKCSPDELKLIEQWFHFQDKNSAAQVVFSNEKEAQATEKRLWKRIKTTALPSRKPITYLSAWLSIGAAACVVLLLGYYWLHKDSFTSTVPAALSQQGIESINTSNSQQKLVLPDGSTAILEKNASIIVEEHYGRRSRKVFLQGEAFFEVVRNPKMPFMVYADDLITEVLGTSFRIKPHPGQKTIEVSVKTGRVSVYTTAPLKTKKRYGLILSPNQKGIFDIESKTIQQGIVDAPELIIPDLPKSDFQFEDTPLENITRTMQNAYGIEIVVLNSNLGKCTFTGNLNGLSLQKQLDFVCGSFNIAYEIRGTTVFILGDHCE